jgi:hypothetical protein
MRLILALSAIIGVLIFFSAPAGAAELLGNTGGSGLTYDRVVSSLNNLVEVVLRIAGFIVVIVILYYGARMALAGGDDAAYSAARHGLNLALVGALIIFGVYTIIATVEGLVNDVSSGTTQE